MRKSISIVLAILLIAAGIYAANLIINKEKKARPQAKKVVPTAFIVSVVNGDVPIKIKESGRLTAKNRLEVYSEVQGVMEQTAKEFKPGNEYGRGELMVKIRSADYYANLQAQKSVLQNLITSVLPDLRLDYPEVYQKWDTYLKNFDMDKPVKKLPETSSEKEKFFITGKNIYTTYYNTKNLEIIYEKYTLRAPFKGIITDALVTPGTVVRPGQKLGEFIDPSVYELEIALSKSILPDLKVGKKVTISDSENTDLSWNGKIARINGKVNSTTQTVQVFIELRGELLREGMFLQALIEANPKSNAFEVPRNLLVDDTKLFIVTDSTLRAVPITILHRTNDSMVVSGLDDNMQLVIKPVPGSYPGMVVNPNTQTN